MNGDQRSAVALGALALVLAGGAIGLGVRATRARRRANEAEPHASGNSGALVAPAVPTVWSKLVSGGLGALSSVVVTRLADRFMAKRLSLPPGATSGAVGAPHGSSPRGRPG